MSSIKSYLYDNKIIVQVLDEDPLLKTRHRIVYSRPVKIYKDVDNLITIEFKNNDQKPADIENRDFVFSITQPESNTAVWSTSVTITDAERSIGIVLVDDANVSVLTQELYNYAISYTTGNLTLPAYTDDNWGAIGQLQVISSVF